jgi:carbonic anhydrase
MRYDGKRVGFVSLVFAWLVCMSWGNGYAQDVTGDITVSPPSEAVTFSYEGDTGPDFWGSLSPEWETCGTGMAQSPIDFTAMNITGSDPAVLEFNYNPTPLNILNNGHTIEVTYAPGSSLVVDGNAFEVKQFHFHTPSEHTLEGGAHYPLEMHIVHQSSEGANAVVSVMIRPGAANPALDALGPLQQLIPLAAGVTYNFNALSINVGDLLPATRQFIHYTGSLTTPPCTEGVAWYILQTPIEMSEDQIRILKGALNQLASASSAGTNNRPTQPLNARTISRGGE